MLIDLRVDLAQVQHSVMLGGDKAQINVADELVDQVRLTGQELGDRGEQLVREVGLLHSLSDRSSAEALWFVNWGGNRWLHGRLLLLRRLLGSLGLLCDDLRRHLLG